MTFHQLRIFIQVVDAGGVSRAAEKLGIPQPAVTRAIRSLEKEFGLTFFDRRGKENKLNHHGRILYRHARQLVQESRALEAAMGQIREEESVTVAIIVEAASQLFPAISAAFSDLYPQVRFRALHRDPPAEGGFDDYALRLYSSREKPDDPQSRVLAEEAILLAVQAGGPLGDRERLALIEVKEEGFVSLFKNRSLRQITDSYCREAGFLPRVIFETDNTDTVIKTIRSGHGIAFIPALTWPRDKAGDGIRLLTITDPVCTRSINLGVTGKRPLNRLEKRFMTFLADYFARLTA